MIASETKFVHQLKPDDIFSLTQSIDGQPLPDRNVKIDVITSCVDRLGNIREDLLAVFVEGRDHSITMNKYDIVITYQSVTIEEGTSDEN